MNVVGSEMKISDISIDIFLIYLISVMFDTISVIYPISAIYCRYIGFGPIYRENIRSGAHALPLQEISKLETAKSVSNFVAICK